MFDKLGIPRFVVWMFVFIPISIFLSWLGVNSTIVFFVSILALIPLASVLSFATEQVVLQSNATIGGLLSATFGNFVELVLAILALKAGLVEIVQASLIGSIIGNILFLVGLSLFVGGLKYKHQHFNKNAAGISSTMLIIAVVGLAIPTIFSLTVGGTIEQVRILSDGVALVLALIYIAGLIFALRTHRHLFDSSDELRDLKEKPLLSKKVAIGILLVAICLITLESELIVKAVEHTAKDIGLTQTFIGLVIIATITNIAENSSAVKFALKDKIDISLEIGTSSAIQIALFVVPILVFISHAFNFGFSLVFTLFEIIAVLFSVMIVNYLSSDGECNWLEGAQLLTVYLIIAIAFFFVA
jgi:Ca2+:H+ antiporter